MFGPHQTTELTRFCLNNDEYHIVSVMPGAVFENRYIPHARGFYLAKGDNNPNLILNPFLRRSIDLVYEEILHKSLAVCSNINRGKQG